MRIINDSSKVRNLFAYLRISIIIMILSKKEKGEFIDLIDESLIGVKSEKQLNWVVSPTN